jgi:hypothetical protein
MTVSVFLEKRTVITDGTGQQKWTQLHICGPDNARQFAAGGYLYEVSFLPLALYFCMEYRDRVITLLYVRKVLALDLG